MLMRDGTLGAWFRLGMLIAAMAFGQILMAQGTSPLQKIDFGMSHAEIASALGKPFEVAKWGYDDHTAEVGLPAGKWETFHLNAQSDRMYAIMLHFKTAGDLPLPSSPVDSLMVEPIGQITAIQALNDIPAMAAVCKAKCEVLRTTDASGRRSILVKPVQAVPSARVVYFETAGPATRNLASVPLESRVEWIYILPLNDFDSHHPHDSREAIGTWQLDKQAVGKPPRGSSGT